MFCDLEQSVWRLGMEPRGKAWDAIKADPPSLTCDPHEHMLHVIGLMDKWFLRNNSARGALFELGFVTLFANRGIYPFQRQVSFDLPAVSLDFVLQLPNRKLICISTKASLRERWRQFQHEALLIKNAQGHRNTKFYAIRSYDRHDTWAGKEGPIEEMPSVDVLMYCDWPNTFDEFIWSLEGMEFLECSLT